MKIIQILLFFLLLFPTISITATTAPSLSLYMCSNPEWTAISGHTGERPQCPDSIITAGRSDGYKYATLQNCKNACEKTLGCNAIVRFGGHSDASNWHCRAHSCNQDNITWVAEERWGNGAATCSNYFLTCETTSLPSNIPTTSPSISPSISPSVPLTTTPTKDPSQNPTSAPTENPTDRPTGLPSSLKPTLSPITTPTIGPTQSPTSAQTEFPTERPTDFPSCENTNRPTQSPTQKGNYKFTPLEIILMLWGLYSLGYIAFNEVCYKFFPACVCCLCDKRKRGTKKNPHEEHENLVELENVNLNENVVIRPSNIELIEQ